MPVAFKYHLRKGAWTALDIDVAAPMLEIGLLYADMVRSRVSETGMGARGPYSPYAAHGDGRHWVRPGQPQPQAFKYQILTGPFKGWAVYPSYDFFLTISRKKGKPKTYKRDGRFWAGLTVTMMSPIHTRIHFLGSSKSGLRHRDLARVLLGPERQGLLVPTAEEWQRLNALFAERISDQIFSAASTAAEAQSLRVATARTGSRLNRLVTRLGATGG